MSHLLSPTKILWGDILTMGDHVLTLLQSVKSLSSDGTGVGGVLWCDP